MLFFNQKELLDMAKERGDRIEVCRVTKIEGDRLLGIKDEERLVCQPVDGYLARNRLNHGGTEDTESEQITFYSGINYALSRLCVLRASVVFHHA